MCLTNAVETGGSGSCGGGGGGGGRGETARDGGLDRDGGLASGLCCLEAVPVGRNGFTLLGKVLFRGGGCGIELANVFAVVLFRAKSPDGAMASL